MSIKLPYGIKNGVLVHIGEVSGGLACGCRCPACDSLLIAKKGAIKIAHFAHYKSPECAYGLQTALHLAAKAILMGQAMFRVPAYVVPINQSFISEVFAGQEMFILKGRADYELAPQQTLLVNEVHLEKTLCNIVPDVIIDTDKGRLLVEIAVTHFVDRVKLQKVQEYGISSIEIDLSRWKGELTDEALKEAIVSGIERKKWLYHAGYKELIQLAREKLFQLNQREAEWKENERLRQERFKILAEKNRQQLATSAETANQKREALFARYYKQIFIRPDRNTRQPLELVGCLLKRRELNEKFYAIVEYDCKKCSEFRGIRKPPEQNESFIICLAAYHQEQQGL